MTMLRGTYEESYRRRVGYWRLIFTLRPNQEPRAGHKRYSPTHDNHVLTAVSWADGNGKLDAFVEPDQPVDPSKDKRISGGFYAIMPSPVDSSVWGTVIDFALG